MLKFWVSRICINPDANPDLYLLKSPGTTTRAEDPADGYTHFQPALTIEIWSVNPPGYGGSGGRASLQNKPAMSELAFAEVARATDSAPLVVAGKSQGRVSALYPSASHPVDGLSLRDPPPLRETVLGRHPRGPLRGLARALAAKLPEALDMVDNAAHSDSPAVMLLSQQDRIVPFELQQRVRDAYRGTSR